jgi:hypothetical protein
MAMQRSRIELREQMDLVESRIQTVRNGYIDQAVFSAERDRRFGPIFGEGK